MSTTPAPPPGRAGSGAGTPAAGPVRERGDACPGALRLHSADDGALARVRLPGGLLTVRQAEVLAGVADELGDGHLDLTSRGNVQLRGLAAGCGGTVAGRLRPHGLLPSDRHDRIRNVAASPLCGLDGRHQDSGSGPGTAPPQAGAAPAGVQAWARELDGLLCADDVPGVSADLTGLSGRFLFGLDDGRGDIVALRPDVTLIASGAGQAGLCFGTAGPGLRISTADAPRAAVLAAAEFLAALEAYGSAAWRVRELPPEQRPTAAGLAERLTAAGIACTPLPLPRLPLGDPPAPGLVTGHGGRRALSVTAPLGRLTSAQWRLAARVAAEEGNQELRVTPWRGLVVPGLPAHKAPQLLAALADAGFVTSAESPWHRAGACAGRPGCAKSLADVRADAAECLAGGQPAGAAAALPVYWSGCERRCGRPGGGRWVDVLATGDGYEVSLRGSGEPDGPVRRVATAGLPGAVAAARVATTAT
ncbi:cobalamin biosynthesis protein CobG [Streptomyces rectiverticillatus]|uniref:cobalamin biosynthesis protein CobG n=1 Tax=Streptomyces rectiverticillatus TaxID=173860 RepID=UPI001FE3C82A|nr:cobalamin biosynthesis protein CobG [Streptomyces rectiverticillatus]